MRRCKLQRRDIAKIPIKGYLKIITNAWYIINDILILRLSTIKEIIKEFCQRYRDRLEVHPNNFAANFMKAREIMKRQEKETYRFTKLIFYN